MCDGGNPILRDVTELRRRARVFAMDAHGDISAFKNVPPAKELRDKQIEHTPAPRPSRRKNVVTETGDAEKRRSKIDAASSEEQLKYRRFLSEPMGNKGASALPGITPVAECKLHELGCGTAVKVWGKFLTLQKNPELFQIWLHDVSRASTRAVRACRRCLEEYCDMYM